jgi:hypothetical protein
MANAGLVIQWSLTEAIHSENNLDTALDLRKGRALAVYIDCRYAFSASHAQVAMRKTEILELQQGFQTGKRDIKTAFFSK